MPLLNKLFPSRRGFASKVQDNLREKLFSFNSDQVRTVLFCECDYRGRKLLFDSRSVEKVQLAGSIGAQSTDTKGASVHNREPTSKMLEVIDGSGYVYTKRDADIAQLGEMIFGSVAMSYRGTSFKIHQLQSPSRLMCTHVFPSPRRPHNRAQYCARRRSDDNPPIVAVPAIGDKQPRTDSTSLSSYASSSTSSLGGLEQSAHLECSSASLNTSSSAGGRSSISSATSDNLLFYRSISQGVPKYATDPGYCRSTADSALTHSFNSLPNDDPASSYMNSVFMGSFSNGSLYKRWLRSASTSLHRPSNSIPNGSASASADDVLLRPSKSSGHRTSKLGLAVIIDLTNGQEEKLEHFLMEHAVLLESMLSRARVLTETAYLRHRCFVSIMYELAVSTARWLADLLLGPQMTSSLQSRAYRQRAYQHTAGHVIDNAENGVKYCVDKCAHCKTFTHNDTGSTLSGLSRLLRNTASEWDFSNMLGNSANRQVLHNGGAKDDYVSGRAERCMREMCELLDTLDRKDTNFFFSTLITAVLTHHLGWVNTVLPMAPTSAAENPLWGQLNDLYGAVGSPTKIVQTIVIGSSLTQRALIVKLLNAVTYFLRCGDVRRSMSTRPEADAENCAMEDICRQADCLPREDYKTFGDHLAELRHAERVALDIDRQQADIVDKRSSVKEVLKPVKSIKPGLAKSRSLVGALNNLSEQNDSEKFSSGVSEVCRTSLIENGRVLFVLGENDELIGLNKSSTNSDDSDSDTFPFKDSDFEKVSSVPSSLLVQSRSQIDLSAASSDASPVIRSHSGRAQSVPPPDTPQQSKKTPPDKQLESSGESLRPSPPTAKYKYCGVKFNFQQYPQIVANYMRSKNIELSNLHFFEKNHTPTTKAAVLFTTYDFGKFEGGGYDEHDQSLQTPSNATELAFNSSDDFMLSTTKECSKKASNGYSSKCLVKCKIKQCDDQILNTPSILTAPKRLRILNLPMPMYKDIVANEDVLPNNLSDVAQTLLLHGVSDHYITGLALQGIVDSPLAKWIPAIQQDLITAVRYPPLDQPIDEAVAIVANTDTWEVQLISSHTYIVEKGSSGIRIGMSQLVGTMLESVMHMWKMQTPAESCLQHVERKMQELFIQSKALVDLLHATEFCSMDILTSTLQLEVNDVPLLMSVASTHSPHILQKYGLSFQ